MADIINGIEASFMYGFAFTADNRSRMSDSVYMGMGAVTL